MKITVKIVGSLLDAARRDLSQRHPFAHERVGFFAAGATYDAHGLILVVRSYHPVADDDYEYAPCVGARIGANAMRRAVQAAYRPPSALLHVHTHGGRGKPNFSSVDLESAEEFVPGFFQAVPRMPHGLLVLSGDAATGRLWLDPNDRAVSITEFVRTDATMNHEWSNRYELA